MNSRTLWTIIIKVLGIVLIVQFIPYLVQFIAVLPLSIARPFSEFILMAGISTLTIVVYLFLLWLSFFKTSWIIDRLRLEKGMENQKIEFPTDRKVILSIVIMVTGGFILVRSIPGLLGSLYQFSQNSNVLFQHRVSANGIIIKVSEALIGLLLFVYGTPIGNYIDKKTKNEITEEGNNVDTNHE